MSDVTLRNINPLGAVSVPLLGRELKAGEEFSVPAKIAGKGPTVDKDGNVTDLGEGLLAQVGNYELVKGTSGPTVEQLREQLKARGLDTKGRKAALVARLAKAEDPPPPTGPIADVEPNTETED